MRKRGKSEKWEMVLAEHRERRTALEGEAARIASLSPQELLGAQRATARKEAALLGDLILECSSQAKEARKAERDETAEEAEGLLALAQRLHSTLLTIADHEGDVSSLIPLLETAQELRRGFIEGLDLSRFGAFAEWAEKGGMASLRAAPVAGSAPKKNTVVQAAVDVLVQQYPGEKPGYLWKQTESWTSNYPFEVGMAEVYRDGDKLISVEKDGREGRSVGFEAFRKNYINPKRKAET